MYKQYEIRELKPSEYALMNDFLYEAIFQKEGYEKVSRDILQKPELQVYSKDFGLSHDDVCLCSVVEQKVAGMVWSRIIPGYGSLDAQTPELAIALYQAYRNHGIGTVLLLRMLEKLKKKAYKQVSLAVQKDNPAVRMYLRIGFVIVKEMTEEYLMVYCLN